MQSYEWLCDVLTSFFKLQFCIASQEQEEVEEESFLASSLGGNNEHNFDLLPSRNEHDQELQESSEECWREKTRDKWIIPLSFTSRLAKLLSTILKKSGWLSARLLFLYFFFFLYFTFFFLFVSFRFFFGGLLCTLLHFDRRFRLTCEWRSNLQKWRNNKKKHSLTFLYSSASGRWIKLHCKWFNYQI